MPCSDGWDPAGAELRAAKSDLEVYKAQAKLYKGRCDDLARLLCKICQKGPVTDPELASWWETHQAQDRVNAQIERMRSKP